MKDWFEDNILSKFTSMTARRTDGKENQIVSEFRSIDNDVKTNEKIFNTFPEIELNIIIYVIIMTFLPINQSCI